MSLSVAISASSACQLKRARSWVEHSRLSTCGPRTFLVRFLTALAPRAPTPAEPVHAVRRHREGLRGSAHSAGPQCAEFEAPIGKEAPIGTELLFVCHRQIALRRRPTGQPSGVFAKSGKRGAMRSELTGTGLLHLKPASNRFDHRRLPRRARGWPGAGHGSQLRRRSLG
jgi:hypothetical protein